MTHPEIGESLGLEKNKIKKILREIPNISHYVLRHTFCTKMATLGMNPKALQCIMGDKKITMTLNYYARAICTSAKEEMDRVLAY